MCGMDAEASSSARALYLIRQAQVVEELLRGARMVGGEITERVAAFVRRELERLHGRETAITGWQSLLCDTVLQVPLTDGHLAVSGCQGSPRAWPPEWERDPLPATLKRLVFGVEAMHETFARVTCSQTHEKAGIALRACVLILEQAMRPRNCLRILVLAASTGNQRLLARSAAVALLHFRQAVMEDRAGLLMLPKEVLGTLLAHDCLQAGEELVFSALGLWVMADVEERLQYLYPLTVQCVRLRSMGMEELSSVDQHPLIPKCPSTLKLVAFAYLSACYGSSLPEEHAPLLAKSRMQRVAINPRALGLLRYGGAELDSPERQAQLPGDLFRLWPALEGKVEEASPAAYATLQQLQQEWPGGESDASAIAAHSAEGLTHGVCRLLRTQGRDASLGVSKHTTAQELFCHLDSARWSSAVAPNPPQRQPGSNEIASSMLTEPPQDLTGHGACPDTADESASCKAAQLAAASNSAPGGAQARAGPVDFDVFDTSPSQTRKHVHLERPQAEAQRTACRHLLEHGKPPPGAGLQRRLFL